MYTTEQLKRMMDRMEAYSLQQQSDGNAWLKDRGLTDDEQETIRLLCSAIFANQSLLAQANFINLNMSPRRTGELLLFALELATKFQRENAQNQEYNDYVLHHYEESRAEFEAEAARQGNAPLN